MNRPEGTTICSVCQEEKDNSEFTFYRNRHTKDGKSLMVNTNCKACQTIHRKQLQEIKRKYSCITEPPYGTPCDACQRPVYRNWQLDHDHTTGEFRGWICKQCNTGLGNLGDSIEELELRLEYLKRAKVKQNPGQMAISTLDGFLED